MAIVCYFEGVHINAIRSATNFPDSKFFSIEDIGQVSREFKADPPGGPLQGGALGKLGGIS